MEPVVHGNLVATAHTMDGKSPDFRLGKIGAFALTLILIGLLSLETPLHPLLRWLSYLLTRSSKPVPWEF